MKGDSVWNIITRHLAGESTAEEKQALDEWTKKDNLNKGTLDRLREMWEYNPVRQSGYPKIYEAFKTRLNHYEKRQTKNPFLYYAVRVAAVLFLLIGTAALVNTMVPFYNNREITWQEITVPKGSRTSILLPDSSKVWISNNSKIRYPDKFASGTRELELTGEAYFEVVHNKKKPFIVHAGSDRIKVLGTKFAVSAYPDDSVFKAELLTGKIQVDIHTGKGDDSYKSFIVKPSYSLVYNKTSGDITSAVIPDGFLDYWKNGIYTFSNESLESLAQKIDRIYNVQVVFENDYIKTKRFSGNISIDDNIFTFMEAVKRTSLEPINYRYDNNTIFINLKSN